MQRTQLSHESNRPATVIRSVNANGTRRNNVFIFLNYCRTARAPNQLMKRDRITITTTQRLAAEKSFSTMNSECDEY